MRPFAIAGLQLPISNRHTNLPSIADAIAHTAHMFPWVQMIVLSELASFGASSHRTEPLPGETEEFYAGLARKHGLWIVTGSIYEAAPDGIYNTASVIGPDGTLVTRYRKIFPFRPYEEGIKAGDRFCVFDIPHVGRFGLMICYDLWFPEIARTLASEGAEVILCPTLTNTVDRDIELAITRASAAINQCYLFGINGLGDGGYGRSIVAGPTGEILHEAGSGQEIIALEIDLDQSRHARMRGCKMLGQNLKSFRDRQVDFPVYRVDYDRKYLHTLGPMEMPRRK